MGALGIVLAVAGAAMEARGAYEEGQAAKRAAAYNARASATESNQQIERIYEIAARVRGENVTRAAKSGVTMGGSPMAVLAENTRQTVREAGNIYRASQAYQSLQHKMGQSAVEAARWNMAGGILRGAGSAIAGAAGGSGSGYNFAGATGTPGTSGLYRPNLNWNPYTPMRRAGAN